MSGVVSGIAKVFRPIAQVATRIIRPVAAIGAALFTGGAAMGAGPAMGGTLGTLLGIGGTLANTFGTAFERAGFPTSGLASGAGFGAGPPMGLMPGMVGNGFETGMSTNGWGGGGAMTNEGAYAQGLGATTAQNIAQPTSRGLFSGVTGGSMLAGLGSGIGQWMQAQQDERMLDKQLSSRERIARRELDFMRERDKRISDSYSVGDQYHESAPTRVRYSYDPASGQVVPVGV